MVADDTAGSGDGSEGEKSIELRTPPHEDSGGHEDAELFASAPEAPSPSDGPPEEAKEATEWKFAVLFLCFFGFMSSIKPGEPFITPCLLSPEKNFTREQVSGLAVFQADMFVFMSE